MIIFRRCRCSQHSRTWRLHCVSVLYIFLVISPGSRGVGEGRPRWVGRGVHLKMKLKTRPVSGLLCISRCLSALRRWRWRTTRWKRGDALNEGIPPREREGRMAERRESCDGSVSLRLFVILHSESNFSPASLIEPSFSFSASHLYCCCLAPPTVLHWAR